MKTHLLRVETGAAAFAPLVAAARAAGARVGWLELAAPAPLPEALAAAATAGVLRAVAAGAGRVASVKPLRGEPVLADLLHEHFAGCALVLAHGPIAAPLLEPENEGWRLTPPGEAAQHLDTASLLARLRRPRRLTAPRSG